MVYAAKDKNPFALLVHSLCPTIVGHELVKAGILLSLLGGNQKNRDRGDLPVRPDIHCLVVGDPGMGKSQMLKAATKAAPRGVYICGNTSVSVPRGHARPDHLFCDSEPLTLYGGRPPQASQ